MGGSNLVQSRVQSQSLDPTSREIIIPEVVAAVLEVPMTQLIIVPAPVTDTGLDATMLQLMPAPVTDTGVEATMLQLIPALVTVTGVEATMLQLIPALVTVTGVESTMLQLIPAPNTIINTILCPLTLALVADTMKDTILTPVEDKRSAQAHIYQTPLASAYGKKLRYPNGSEGIGAIDPTEDIRGLPQPDDYHYNQRSKCGHDECIHVSLRYVIVRACFPSPNSIGGTQIRLALSFRS